MANYNFRKDLPVAKKTEKEVGRLLNRKYGAEILDFEDSNKFDILALVKGKKVTFEVKEDFMCEKTGNVAVEFECRGKPSGIEATESDFYIYKLTSEKGKPIFILHPTEKIRELIREKKYFRIVNGGDKGSNSMNYLFRKGVFVESGKII